LHVLEAAFLAEVVDPKSSLPTEAGGVGELILTPLRRAGSPLLRYRTGDLVRPVHQPAAVDSPPCSCGRIELALEGGILGRADDMLIIRGVNVFPSAVEDIIRTCGEVAEYRADVSVEDELTQLRLLVEPAADCADPSRLERRLQKALHDAFALRVPVSAVPRGTLPRDEMKAHRWVRRQPVRV
jgi:phenylacetate-CoA ligase